MLHSHSQLPAPGRLFLPGCAIAAGLLAVSAPVFAAPTPASSSLVAAPMTLRVGKTVTFPLSPQATYTLESGASHVLCEVKDGALQVRAVDGGTVRLRISAPDRDSQVVLLRLVQPTAMTQQVLSQVVERAGVEGSVPTRQVASPTSEQAPQAATDPAANATSPAISAATSPAVTSPLAPSALSTDLSGPDAMTPPLPAPALPALTGPGPGQDGIAPSKTIVSVPASPTRAMSVRSTPAPARSPQISPSLPAPARSAKANVAYTTTPRLPSGIAAGGSRQGINVTQGLARLLSFPSNILAVFFSDPNVMDARAINARTIAVTGIGPGPSTLAVFTSRFPGDAVGRANIYRIQTTAKPGGASPQYGDPRAVESAINVALGDPRIRAAVLTLPDGSIAARLAGTVRNEAEVQAAVTTASFYVPRVISSLYTDPNSPTLDAVLSGAINITPESGLQDSLRKITGNDTIELVPLPTGLAFKAIVSSPDEAEALMRVLPTLNQQVIPFIVVRGQDTSSSPYYNATVPLLQGEDRQLTQKLQDVTGIRTVYAVRASTNGLAAYGNVRTRAEYDTVRRYMSIMAQSSTPTAVAGTSQGGSTLRPQGGEGPFLRNYDPTAGYNRNLGLQMFVRITDPAESVIRKVTVETNVVEINRISLKNLGVEYGSATLTDETPATNNGGTVTVVRDGAGNPVVDANGNVVTQVTGATTGVITRTINPAFNAGSLLGGNGFAGTGGFSGIDPFRARLNILFTNNDARLLARPNVTAVEGMSAQITIGGERPVPSVVATQGAVGTQVEFRRYGVIISMRPTVTESNTILLQIRADITQPDQTYAINLNGAIIPGETVRSVDTTLNVHPGDTIILGGLITNEKRVALSKVPFLGDLPIIGSLFRSKRFDNNETELAIFMTPRIETMPATMQTIEALNAAPSFPLLPSRQESQGILFQNSTGG